MERHSSELARHHGEHRVVEVAIQVGTTAPRGGSCLGAAAKCGCRCKVVCCEWAVAAVVGGQAWDESVREMLSSRCLAKAKGRGWRMG